MHRQQQRNRNLNVAKILFVAIWLQNVRLFVVVIIITIPYCTFADFGTFVSCTNMPPDIYKPLLIIFIIFMFQTMYALHVSYTLLDSPICGDFFLLLWLIIVWLCTVVRWKEFDEFLHTLNEITQSFSTICNLFTILLISLKTDRTFFFLFWIVAVHFFVLLLSLWEHFPLNKLTSECIWILSKPKIQIWKKNHKAEML